MQRIFLSLAIVAMTMLAANIVIGLNIGGYNRQADVVREANRAFVTAEQVSSANVERLAELKAERNAEYDRLDPIAGRFQFHFLFGLAASLVVMLVNCISVTYFIGTSRWCREVVDTYKLDTSAAARAAALKRRSFPWSLVGILTMLAIAAFGAASDPSTHIEGTAYWARFHYFVAVLGTGLMGYALWQQYARIRENARLIDELVAEVRRIRIERGWDSESGRQIPSAVT